MNENEFDQETVEYILTQLDDRGLPFEDYCFQRQADGRHLAPILGKGGFAQVRSAVRRRAKKREKFEKTDYALKVIGFGKHGAMNPEEFFENAQAQKYMYESQQNIVQIYDIAEVHIWLDQDLTVTATKVFRSMDDVLEERRGENENPNYIDDRNRTFLPLQFIVMERLIPVVIPGEDKKPVFGEVPLTGEDETEYLRVAYDIGNALRYMYKEIGMLHRDIKPQNIFYDPRRKEYKLGDFGIAKVTEEGLTGDAEAYTAGYAAPEVLDGRAQKYDNTADIYSLGMTMYLLLNDLEFPAPPEEMYREDYKLPMPKHAIWPLVEIIKKMCRHNPEERYQDMEEVLHDIEELATDSGLGYKRKHARGELALGLMLLHAGIVFLELAFYPSLDMEMGIPMYLFAGLCIYMGVRECTEESWVSGASTFALLVIGMYLIISTGFSAGKILLLFLLAISPGAFDLAFGGAIVAADITCRGIHAFLQGGGTLSGMFSDYRFAAMLMVTFGIVLVLEASLLKDRKREDSWSFYRNGFFWVAVLILYLSAVAFACNNPGTVAMTTFVLGQERTEALAALPLLEMGLAGVALSVYWILRQKVLRWAEKRKAN